MVKRPSHSQGRKVAASPARRNPPPEGKKKETKNSKRTSSTSHPKKNPQENNLKFDPIQHVIVLMLENRSFDHMLGVLKQVNPEVEGIDPLNPGTNTDLSGVTYQQEPIDVTRIEPDPPHETPSVLNQIRDGNFVAEYQRQHPQTSPDQRRTILGYYSFNFLPALHQLAQEYTLCDHWFSSVPGPTWTNRFFVHSGTSLGRVSMPTGVFDLNWHWYDQTTIYDRLNEQNLSWKIYYGDIAQSLVLVHQFSKPKNTGRYEVLNQFFKDEKKSASTFPAFSFIEPHYFWSEANDDHPPHDVLRGQKLVADIYNAIRANADLWASSLLVILYDEHGGFFDHVLPPPGAMPPDTHKEEYAFDQLGVRVPAVLVSPWVGKTVSHTQFDHTSLLKYLIEKWDLGPLGQRTASAESIGSLIDTSLPMRTSTLESISLAGLPQKPPIRKAPPSLPLNDHQKALIAFTHYLEGHIKEKPETKVKRARKMMVNVPAQIEVAKERFKLYVRQEKAKLASPKSPSSQKKKRNR